MQFANLWEAFQFLVYCPLCHNRLKLQTLSRDDDYEISSVKFQGKTLTFKLLNDLPFSIDLLTNKIVSPHKKSMKHIKIHIKSITQSCNQYHFDYIPSFDIEFDKQKVSNISHARQFYILQDDPFHYSILSNFTDNKTTIRIVIEGITKTIELPAQSFTHLSRPEIIKKINTYNLLA